MVVSDLTEHFKRFGSESSKKVGDALEKMGIKKDLKRLNQKYQKRKMGFYYHGLAV